TSSSTSPILPLPRSPTLFPYTTLFRSKPAGFPAGKFHGQGLRRRVPPPSSASARGRQIRATAGRHSDSAIVAGQSPILHAGKEVDRKSTRLNSSHSQISYAVFCLKKKR